MNARDVLVFSHSCGIEPPTGSELVEQRVAFEDIDYALPHFFSSAHVSNVLEVLIG